MCELLLARKGGNLGKSRWQLYHTRKMMDKKVKQVVRTKKGVNWDFDYFCDFDHFWTNLFQV